MQGEGPGVSPGSFPLPHCAFGCFVLTLALLSEAVDTRCVS